MWLLLIPVVILFMLLNVIVGCALAIRLGYGPPDWKTALNLILPLTTLQDQLNAGRDWLERKAPWADKFLDRMQIPKPIIIVEVPETPEEEDEAEEEGEAIDEINETGEVDAEGGNVEQPEDFCEDAIEEILTGSGISAIESIPSNASAAIDQS